MDKQNINNNYIDIIEGKGTPVGLFKTPIFRQKEMALPKRFKIIMFSDGVLEILPQKNIVEGNQYLYSILNDKDIDIDKIKSKLDIKEGQSSFPDDLTFLMIEKV
jgi:sigma-B regulation protein RsbU (phosphoserine phosphatase)